MFDPNHSDFHQIRDVPLFVGVSLTFGEVDDVLLACHGHLPLRDHEWVQLVKRICTSERRMIVSTLGAEPDIAQRHQLAVQLAAIGHSLPRIAVLTASSPMRWAHIARSLVASLGARAFAFDEVDAAARFLGCHASPERLHLARNRAQYLLEKRAGHQQFSWAR